MTVVESDLKIVNIRVLNYRLDAILPDAPEENQPVPDHGTPEIDFEIARSDENGIYRILVVLQSATESVGYSYSVRAAGFFVVPDEAKDEDREKLVLYSALPMMISAIRDYLSEITAHSVYGRYLLPSVDLTRLLSEWRARGESVR